MLDTTPRKRLMGELMRDLFIPEVSTNAALDSTTDAGGSILEATVGTGGNFLVNAETVQESMFD